MTLGERAVAKRTRCCRQLPQQSNELLLAMTAAPAAGDPKQQPALSSRGCMCMTRSSIIWKSAASFHQQLPRVLRPHCFDTSSPGFELLCAAAGTPALLLLPAASAILMSRRAS
jgi:hypothetical protein